MLLLLTSFRISPVIFYVSDDVVYGSVINNHRGPNEKHAQSVN